MEGTPSPAVPRDTPAPGTERQVRADPAPAEKGWREVARPIPLAVAILVSAAATVVQLLSTYDGFFSDAIGSPAAWGLILMNVALTVAVLLALAPVFKPRNVLLYALTIALTWQALIATDLAVEPIAGTDQVGEQQKINVGFIQTELEKTLSGSIDDPVEDAKRAEIRSLQRMYPTARDLPRLRRRLNGNLRTDGSVDDAERKTTMDLVDGVIADKKLTVPEKDREIALAVYSTVGRDPIKDLVAQKQ
jgi:hypothetical protein